MVALVVKVLAGDAKVNQIYLIYVIGINLEIANHDVVRLKIAVNVPFVVKSLKKINDANAERNGALQAEVLAVLPKDLIDIHSQPLLGNEMLGVDESAVDNHRKSFGATHLLHYFKLLVVDVLLGVDLDYDLLVCLGVHCDVDLAEATLRNLFYQLETILYQNFLLRFFFYHRQLLQRLWLLRFFQGGIKLFEVFKTVLKIKHVLLIAGLRDLLLLLAEIGRILWLGLLVFEAVVTQLLNIGECFNVLLGDLRLNILEMYIF